MKIRTLGAMALAIPVCLLAVDQNETYQKTFPLSGADRKLIISNIRGDIQVTADNGSDVRVTVREEWSADTAEELARARSEIKNEVIQSGNIVKFSLEGLSRNDCCERRSFDGHVRFRHDYEVKVPRDIHLELRTVNGSEISVNGVRGDFRLRNVNGGISMTAVAGAGSIETVNGTLTASFAANPAKPVEFRTVNGAIDVTFQPGLNADLLVETMHGDAYTDFEVAPMPTQVSIDRSAGGRRFRLDRIRKLRVGAGGLEYRFKTLNGTIKIRKNGN